MISIRTVPLILKLILCCSVPFIIQLYDLYLTFLYALSSIDKRNLHKFFDYYFSYLYRLHQKSLKCPLRLINTSIMLIQFSWKFNKQVFILLSRVFIHVDVCTTVEQYTLLCLFSVLSVFPCNS